MLHYDPKLKKRSRELRNNSTLAESASLEPIEEKQNVGLPVLRQRPIYKYIVDFYCPKRGLVLEIDGESHREKFARDQRRQKNLENLGLSVLRFYDRA
jgi:very-short-patch-repair endonuclease